MFPARSTSGFINRNDVTELWGLSRPCFVLILLRRCILLSWKIKPAKSTEFTFTFKILHRVTKISWKISFTFWNIFFSEKLLTLYVNSIPALVEFKKNKLINYCFMVISIAAILPPSWRLPLLEEWCIADTRCALLTGNIPWRQLSACLPYKWGSEVMSSIQELLKL